MFIMASGCNIHTWYVAPFGRSRYTMYIHVHIDYIFFICSSSVTQQCYIPYCHAAQTARVAVLFSRVLLNFGWTAVREGY